MTTRTVTQSQLEHLLSIEKSHTYSPDTTYSSPFLRLLVSVDRGHLIPHLSGGEFGPNIFRQDRALNRGWSDEGKRFRALEREAAAAPGTFYFGHLLYQDDTAYPMAIEIGILRDGTLHVDRFQNKSRAADRPDS